MPPPPPAPRLLARDVLVATVVLQSAAASMAAMMALLLLVLLPLCPLLPPLPLPLLILDALRLAADEDSAAVELTTADKISPNSVRPLRGATVAAAAVLAAAAADLQSSTVTDALAALDAVLAVELRDMLVDMMAADVARRAVIL